MEPKTLSSMSDLCREKHENHSSNFSIGVVIDQRSRVGKEVKEAMELALQDFSHCLNVSLHIRDLHGSSARAASTGEIYFLLKNMPTTIVMCFFFFFFIIMIIIVITGLIFFH